MDLTRPFRFHETSDKINPSEAMAMTAVTIHVRALPAILEQPDREPRLTGTPEDAWETLAPYPDPDDRMVAWPVRRRGNTQIHRRITIQV